MKAIISPSVIAGSINAPASKSAMQRACAAALLKGGKTILNNPGASDDDLAAIGIIQQLGATVDNNGDSLVIYSNGINPINTALHCGESGLSVRMFTSIAAVSGFRMHVTGSGSLLKRPLHFFEGTLPLLGVKMQANNGYLPLEVQGPLVPKNITVDGSMSSQYLTGLLFAYAAADARDVTITVNDLASKPYIDVTLKVLKDFGLKSPQNNNYRSFYFDGMPLGDIAHTLTYHVEGDWSGAAFALVGGAVNGNVTVKGLDAFSPQADKAILGALMQSEAILSVEQDQVAVRKKALRAFHFDARDCPDLFPPLVALASCCTGTSVIEGVSRLTYKESNRALTLQQEFSKLGVSVKTQDDLMIINGGVDIKGGVVQSHHDHRIAMALAIAALRANSDVVIEDAEAVAKSYPQFWLHLQSLGASVTLIHND